MTCSQPTPMTAIEQQRKHGYTKNTLKRISNDSTPTTTTTSIDSNTLTPIDENMTDKRPSISQPTSHSTSSHTSSQASSRAKIPLLPHSDVPEEIETSVIQSDGT